MNKHKPQSMTKKTIEYYEANSIGFWQGTQGHDVSQNINALLNNIQAKKPFKILDLGCGPGRDLKVLRELGHEAYGLDGSATFCQMASKYSGCKVYHQDFIHLDLPQQFFDGIYANASLFHMPKENLTGLLNSLHCSLNTNGILFSSNPRGNGEDFEGPRYANFMELEEYSEIVEREGFELLDHYYRPQGQPKENCHWLACVFRKIG